MLGDYFDVSPVHGAIAEQMAIVPDGASEHFAMILETPLPAAWILLPNGSNRDNEVDEL